jgi:hypothetical protein
MLESFMDGLKEIHDYSRLRKALISTHSNPFANMSRYFKWKSSEAMLAMKPFLPGKFEARMRRRAEKQSPLGAY